MDKFHAYRLCFSCNCSFNPVKFQIKREWVLVKSEGFSECKFNVKHLVSILIMLSNGFCLPTWMILSMLKEMR